MFFTIFFPSVCVFFLGTFLEKVEASDGAVGELSVVYSVENGDMFSASAFENFIHGLESDGTLTTEKVSEMEAQNFDSDVCSASVVLDGSDIVIYKGKDRIKNRTVKAIFDSYSKTASAYMSAAAVDPMALTGIKLSGESFIQSKDLGTNRSMMDYYAVTMAVMIIFMGSCISGASAYTEEYDFFTIDRLNISTVSKSKIYFGKIIGNMPMIIIQIASVILSSTLLFGAKYCNAPGLNLLLIAMFISVSLAALSVGVLINLLWPKIPAPSVITPLMWVMMFLSGTFQKDIHINGFSEKLPIYAVQSAAFDLTVFSRTEKTVSVIIVSLITFAVIVAAGAVKVSVRSKNI
ncbi:MAG: ABC transporter permease [Oscillospiraceae bacterium]|nr:ABC transporter permease [Oscillospiraceae bacterium]